MGDGDDIVIRVMEAVADERVIKLLQKELYPKPLMDKFTEMNTRIDGLTAQLTAKDNDIAALQKRVEELEESADRPEQYSRRSRKPARQLKTPTAKSSRWEMTRFSSDKARDAVYHARTGLKVYNSQNREAPVFVNDDLTNRRAKLAFGCRKLKKENKIADTWTNNGKVVMKDLTGKISEVGGPAAPTQAVARPNVGTDFALFAMRQS